MSGNNLQLSNRRNLILLLRSNARLEPTIGIDVMSIGTPELFGVENHPRADRQACARMEDAITDG